MLAKEDELGRLFRHEKHRLEMEVQKLTTKLVKQEQAVNEVDNLLTTKDKLLAMLATSEAQVRGFQMGRAHPGMRAQ